MVAVVVVVFCSKQKETKSNIGVGESWSRVDDADQEHLAKYYCDCASYTEWRWMRSKRIKS